MSDLYECNGFTFKELSEANRYASFLFNATGIVHAIVKVERL